MTLDIIMGTYDRFIPYIKAINSTRSALASDSVNVKLLIGVDTKLSKSKFILKKILTKIILRNLPHSFDWGGPSIGETRDILIRKSTADFFMNFDDDDLINAKNLIDSTSHLSKYVDTVSDIINFPFYSDEDYIPHETKVHEFNSWKAKLWMDASDKGVSVGQSSIFSRDLYMRLNRSHRYYRHYVDDMLPNHIMYYSAKSITQINCSLIKRCRGENSLMNTTNIDKLSEIIGSLSEFKEWLYAESGRELRNLPKIWEVTLLNQVNYHKDKSGVRFSSLILGYFKKSKRHGVSRRNV